MISGTRAATRVALCATLLASLAAGESDSACQAGSTEDDADCGAGSDVRGMLQIGARRASDARRVEGPPGSDLQQPEAQGSRPSGLGGAPPPLALVNSFPVPEDAHEYKSGEGLESMGHGEECDGDCPPDTWGGDMVLDPEQHAAMLLAVNTSSQFQIQQWPDGIVKYWWDRIQPAAKEVLVKAMKEWEAKTCVTFQETSERGHGTVRFTSVGWGSYTVNCWASMGYSAKHTHFLLLNPGGCETLGVALHELGHTLGLDHEHQRPGASEFIEIQSQNLPENAKQWLEFDKIKTDQQYGHGIPYDMGSIMHYGNTAFSKNGKPTITVKQNDVFGNCRMGQRAFLSKGDILTTNQFYGCPDAFCADLHKGCKGWKESGYCSGEYQEWMGANCPHSCGKCECADKDATNCPKWAKKGYCLRDEKVQRYGKWMKENCPKSCGNCKIEDTKSCRDLPVYGEADGCNQYKDDELNGCSAPDASRRKYFVSSCPKSCNLCPHQPYCF